MAPSQPEHVGRRVYAATKNAGKFGELHAILGALGWDVQRFEAYRDVAEDGDSYTANAALKARALRAQLDAAGIAEAALGDDSGLEVEALDARPGVLSARYGGAGATWAERRAELLRELACAGGERAARFVCVLFLAAAGGEEWSATGHLQGRIASQERGDGGFSYDPIFEVDDGRTLAEMSAQEKNAISHRAAAARALVKAAERV